MIESHVKTKLGREPITAYFWEEANLPMLTFKPLQRNHKVINYATDFAVLDTETSHNELFDGWIYQWAFKIKKTYVYGRKPSEFIEFLTKTAERYQLNDKKRMIIYIHNASYDLQYLKHYLCEYDPRAEFFAINAHSIIICDVLGFRFLCSWKLTNLSLNALSKNYAVKYEKAVGEIDYNKVRYQDSKLTKKDWYYMFSDVAAQADGITGFLKAMGYKYAFEAPYTSTGFVRTACRKAAAKDLNWRREFQNSALDLEMYNLCSWCFMGGVCIASFKYAGETVRVEELPDGCGLGHKDFTSSYPARQMLDYFPEGAGSWYGEIESREELEELLNTYCCIFELTLYNVHIKPGVTAPCIPSSKCVGLKEPVRLNGKLVYAKQLSIAVTELDYKWIKKQYTADDMKVDRMLIFKRGKIPDWLKKEVYTYFENKCTLDRDSELYMKSKAFLNAIYGMTATKLVRPQWKLDGEKIFTLQTPEDEEKENASQLRRYYKSYNSFMPYQYAIYTTAWARNALYEMIECAGYENFLYCDTDSIFYIKTPENEEKLQKFTEYCRNRAKSAGAYVGNKYLGEPTDEAPIRAFRALHAKCYAMEELDSKTGIFDLKVVIAGIPKKSIKWINGEPVSKTNSEELGDIDNLIDGFTFKHNGGTRCVYNESPPEIKKIKGHLTELSSSAIIDTIEKEISDTMWTVDGYKLLKMNFEQL